MLPGPDKIAFRHVFHKSKLIMQIKYYIYLVLCDITLFLHFVFSAFYVRFFDLQARYKQKSPDLGSGDNAALSDRAQPT